MTDALFDSPDKTLLLDREPPEPPRPPRRKECIQAQDERIRKLLAEGFIVVRGKTSVTVFDFGGAVARGRGWDGYE
jgi:hypothetical protein